MHKQLLNLFGSFVGLKDSKDEEYEEHKQLLNLFGYFVGLKDSKDEEREEYEELEEW